MKLKIVLDHGTACELDKLLRLYRQSGTWTRETLAVHLIGLGTSTALEYLAEHQERAREVPPDPSLEDPAWRGGLPPFTPNGPTPRG